MSANTSNGLLFDLDSPSKTVAQVALPVPVYSVFDYTIPKALTHQAKPGQRVIVPFGARRFPGVIVACNATSLQSKKLKAIENIVDAEPALSATMLAILHESAEQAICPIGLALAAALPTGSAPRPVIAYTVSSRGKEALRGGAARGTLREFLEALARAPATLPAIRRRKQESLFRSCERDGLIEKQHSAKAASAREATQKWVKLAPTIDLETKIQNELKRARKQIDLLRRIAASESRPYTDWVQQVPGAAPLLRALAERGCIVFEERLAPRSVLGTPFEVSGNVELTVDQAQVLAPISEAIEANRAETFLLHGVTGSGKTEVYLRAVAASLHAKRQALVLVPEITLTHQILARLRSRFGDALAVLHSGLTPSERFEQWQRLRRGATPIALGARSALFAPLENLGVIIVDEEHDTAYKNDEGFRYHARELAALRAKYAACPLILGSATPSLETRFAAERGAIRRLSLPYRIGGRPLPAVEIVDLEKEKSNTLRGRKVILSRTLQRATTQALADGGQVIFFLNRRGFSTRIFCYDCGHAERCQHCDISLVYHATDEVLRCHYCDYTVPPPEVCRECGADSNALLGIGTERLEEETRILFPDARIARLDRDTARRKGATEQILRALKNRELDILIGTQMVAKGHDFPGVQLVGVVAADIGLHMPDFRAAERTFQLLTQVAGRAGRGHIPGRVILQTFVPEHYAIRPVIEHDYEEFYRHELAHRAALGYPPHGALVHVLVSGLDAEVAQAAINDLAQNFKQQRLPQVELLGPAPAPLARIQDRYRFQFLLKSASEAEVLRAARTLLPWIEKLPNSVRTRLDVNPVNML